MIEVYLVVCSFVAAAATTFALGCIAVGFIAVVRNKR